MPGKEVIDMEAVQNFKETLDRAHAESIKHGCVQHVNKTLSGAYYVSDWYDGSTVASFENGRQLR